MGFGEILKKEGQPEANDIARPVAVPKDSSLVLQPTSPLYTMEDLVLPRHIKDKLLDGASYLLNSKRVYEEWGLATTHKYSKKMGINLWGPPGTGKTMAAHAIAAYMQRDILLINYAEIESKYVGETSKNLVKAFATAKATNSILFFDEADAILSRRVTNMRSSNDVSVNQTRSVMLMELNNFQDVVIYATNFLENFDPAFMRRIQSHIKFELPDEECRRLLWRKYIPRAMPNNINIEALAQDFSNISGSDIANAILNAAFTAARLGQSFVGHHLVEEAINGILLSKRANEKQAPTVTTRKVSEEYAQEQLRRKEER